MATRMLPRIYMRWGDVRSLPHWYATLFSDFYMLLTFILLALIGRGVAFDFRGKARRGAVEWQKRDNDPLANISVLELEGQITS